MKKFITLVLLLTVVPVLSGCGLIKEPSKDYQVFLEIWGVFDDSADYSELFTEYQKMNPLIAGIRYRKFTIDEYERELINALASGKGPDIFMINNAWLPDYYDKIAPAPPELISEKLYRQTFADVVVEDNLVEGKIVGVPLSADALALYYNKDLFNAAGITSPPRTWQDFNSAVEKLTVIDKYGNIVQSAAAMGTARNINRSVDILTLLMMQSGVEMTDPSGGSATFMQATVKDADGRFVPAAVRALEFYTDFAKPSRSVYTWNNRQRYSIDAFVEGRVAMMINYSWHYNTIARKNEKLRFAVSVVPQINPDKPVNVVNYWTFVVSRNKQAVDVQGVRVPVNNNVRIHEAWEFLKWMTMAPKGNFTLVHGVSGKTKTVVSQIDPAATYLKNTRKPAARKDLLSEQLSDSVLEPFAYGVLNARTWKRKNATAIEGVLAQMIEDVLRGRSDTQSALNKAATRINQLLQ